MTDILGPANAINAVTVRPFDGRSFGAADSWMKDCSSPAAQDGTQILAAMLNEWIANDRSIVRSNGLRLDNVTPVIAEDNSDTMLLRAIEQLIQRGQLNWGGVDSGSADALSVAPATPWLEYKPGARLYLLKGASANATSTPAINVSALGYISIKTRSGALLAQGDLPANALLTLEVDATGSYFRLIGIAMSEIAALVQAGQWLFVLASGTDAYIGAPALSPGTLTTLIRGMAFLVYFPNANTGSAATINIGGLGFRNIVKQNGNSVAKGDLFGYVRLIFDGPNYYIDGTAFSDYIKPPPGNTFYVNGSTGNDGNPGTLALPFASPQGAVNKISSSYATNSQVIVNVSDGTYGGVSIPPSLVGSWVFIGDTSNPSACIISSISPTVFPARGFTGGAGVVFQVSGFSIQSYYENVATNGGACTALDIVGSAPVSESVPAFAVYGGTINFYGPITYSGNGDVVVGSYSGGQVNFGYRDTLNAFFTAWIINGLPALSTAFALASTGGTIVTVPGQYSFTGPATGPRYLSVLNGVINTQGGGPNVFPGNLPGTAPTGLYE